MNTYRYENRPYDIPYRELKMVDEEKSTPWKPSHLLGKIPLRKVDVLRIKSKKTGSGRK